MAIKLSEALAITEDRGRPFSIGFCTYDASRNRGGKIIELTNAMRLGSSHDGWTNGTITVKQIDSGHHPHSVHIHLITHINGQEIHV